MELQDLAPSDGLFKLFIFPGDILVPAEKARLDKFGAALSNSIVAVLTERIRIYTVLNSAKEKAIWSDVPKIGRDWKKLVFSFWFACFPVPDGFSFPVYSLVTDGTYTRTLVFLPRALRCWSDRTGTFLSSLRWKLLPGQLRRSLKSFDSLVWVDSCYFPSG